MPRIPNTSPQTLSLLSSLLASRNSWRHGYDLAQECELKSGTLYPLLMRLADQGFLESRWETDRETHRPRHVYRLTAKGATHAKAQIREHAPRTLKARLARISS